MKTLDKKNIEHNLNKELIANKTLKNQNRLKKVFSFELTRVLLHDKVR